MSSRISGQSVDVSMNGELIHVEKIGLTITDNSSAAQTQGVPDGHVSGDVSGEGDIEVSTKMLPQLTAMAAKAGSWRGIEPFDLLFYAKAGTEELKIEAFGCKLKVDSPLDLDPKGGSVLTHKLKFFITSPDFVRINGIPYLEAEATRNLIG
ncbi:MULTISPECIES: phage protein [Yersinia]|uniref:phage protein n=1 Tax=Yersinia TaxID=629 RepID=UPI000EB05269|nr:phage protein [Yersinia sp. IP36721]